jgi:hypothetical protein
LNAASPLMMHPIALWHRASQLYARIKILFLRALPHAFLSRPKTGYALCPDPLPRSYVSIACARGRSPFQLIIMDTRKAGAAAFAQNVVRRKLRFRNVPAGGKLRDVFSKGPPSKSTEPIFFGIR